MPMILLGEFISVSFLPPPTAASEKPSSLLLPSLPLTGFSLLFRLLLPSPLLFPSEYWDVNFMLLDLHTAARARVEKRGKRKYA